MTKTIALGMLLCLLAWHRSAEAQTSDHLRIDVEGSAIGPDGGEQPNTSMSTGPIVIGKTTSAGFAKLPGMCGLAVASTLQPGATFGWNVDVIPRKVDGDAVTFRVRWLRSRDQGKESSSPAGDLEWTLRPGESLPLDVVPLAPAGTMAPESCKVRAMSVRIAVKFWPRTEEDRRLVVTDLWLIDRQPGGAERSQALSVRGLFNHPTEFYFDTVTEGGVSLDLFGEFRVAADGSAMVMKLETRSRLTQNGRSSTILRDGAMLRARQVESVIQLKPGEVVAVELPRLSENDSGAFANRTFSIRVQSRQVR